MNTNLRSYGRYNVLTEPMIQEIVDGARAALEDKLLSVILYGSVARGDDESDSDVDIALIVREPLTYKEHKEMIHHFSSLCLAYELEFSPMDIERDKFETWKDAMPYYRNIQKEGIVLWVA